MPSFESPFQTRLAEFENETIQKQRHELTLLITELRDRDRELNDTVAAHQRQLSGWDQDRKRILVLEEKCARLERELDSRNEEIHSLSAQLRVTESEEQNKETALNNTQEQLATVTEQHSHAALQLRDLQVLTQFSFFTHVWTAEQKDIELIEVNCCLVEKQISAMSMINYLHDNDKSWLIEFFMFLEKVWWLFAIIFKFNRIGFGYSFIKI